MRAITRTFSAAALPALAGALLWTAAAHAGDGPTGAELGLRTGYGIPFGNVTGIEGDRLNQTASGEVPLWLDAGFRWAPRFYAGLNVRYAMAFEGDALRAAWGTAGVSVTDIVVGLQLGYHVLPAARWDPWVGVGFGHEWLRVANAYGSVGVEGWELGEVQAGVDVRCADWLHLGPFASAAIGQFDDSPIGFAGGSHPLFSIVPKAFHGWIVLGLRTVFDPRAKGSGAEKPAPRDPTEAW